MPKCNCKLCQYGRQFEHHINMVGDEQKVFFSDMFEKLNNISADMDYENALNDGSWPTAIETLEARLTKAKQLKEGRVTA